MDSGEDVIWKTVFTQLCGFDLTSETNMHNCVCVFLFLDYLLFHILCDGLDVSQD